MKHLTAILLLASFTAFSSYAQPLDSGQDISEMLLTIPQVKSVTPLKSTRFGDKYLLSFTQPIDHKNPAEGTFQQRVTIGFVHPDSASVIVCQGYGAEFALMENYRDELSELFNTNDIVVEHRFFPGSTPYPGVPAEETDWSGLTAENAACDLHEITQALKALFTGKWISTGISKGGQNTLIYRSYFPEDVDFSVPYVGPVCRGVEDGKHEPFIENYCGSAAERKIVEEFQTEFLKRRERLQPMFDSFCSECGLTFHLPTDEIYDYCALEFSFSFWQWGEPAANVPRPEASDSTIFSYMMTIVGPDYFTVNPDFTPFFVQAARELGYYGYDTKPFKKYLHVTDADGYLSKIFLPEGVDFAFSTTLFDRLTNFLKTTDARMLFIYGQYDPWSAARIDDPHRANIRIYTDPYGSHKARIKTFPKKTQDEIISVLSSWLYE